MTNDSRQAITLPTRRQMLARLGAGFGSVALTSLLARARAGEGPAGASTVAAEAAHHAPRAERVIFLFMHGGPSQVDTFDHKPMLSKLDGQAFPGELPRVSFAAANGRDASKLWSSPWAFQPYGESGIPVSELYPEVAQCVDDLCVINSMHGSNPAHGAAVLMTHTGSMNFVRPSMGSWVLYGLGSENENLPGFITISPSDQHGGVRNYGSAFLPAEFQGTPLGREGVKLEEASFRYLKPRQSHQLQARQLELLQQMNRSTSEAIGRDAEMEARIRSFEMAFRMQAEAPGVLDLSSESKLTRELYGDDDFGRRCLVARRLAEAGVRFVQVNSGYVWDQHSNLVGGHRKNAAMTDRAIAGLLRDLKQRGMLEDTLVIWGGEFGRTPTREGNNGRDHNPHGFTYWLAGGGVRGGLRFGETDDFGYYAVKDKVHIHDLHATVLHLLGLDHERLTYRYAGRDFRLTDVHGRVVKSILA